MFSPNCLIPFGYPISLLSPSLLFTQSIMDIRARWFVPDVRGLTFTASSASLFRPGERSILHISFRPSVLVKATAIVKREMRKRGAKKTKREKGLFKNKMLRRRNNQTSVSVCGRKWVGGLVVIYIGGNESQTINQ